MSSKILQCVLFFSSCYFLLANTNAVSRLGMENDELRVVGGTPKNPCTVARRNQKGEFRG